METGQSLATRPIAFLFFALLAGTASAQEQTLPGSPSLSYWIVGDGAQTIIMLHGGPGIAHDYLRPEWERLADAGRVVFYDQRGCGRSEAGPSVTWEDHVHDLDRLIRHLSADSSVVLAASSWGAHLALLYTLRHPERVRALLLSGAVRWEYIRPRQSADQASELERISSSGQHRIVAGVAPPTGSLEERISGCEETHAETLESLHHMPRLDALRVIRQPVLLLRGPEDDPRPDGSDELAGVLNKAAVVTLDQGGHNPWISDSDRFFAVATAFLRRTLPPRQ